MNRTDVWAWFLQRVSAVFLLLFLGTHFWVTHYSNLGEIIIFETVQLRLKELTFILVDFGLLSFVIYHALNGLRAVLFDFNVFVRRKRMINGVLIIFGLAALFYGGYGLLAFMG